MVPAVPRCSVDGERFDLQRFYRPPDVDLRLIPLMTYAFGAQSAGANNGSAGSPGSLQQRMAGAFRGTVVLFEPSTMSQQLAAMTQAQIERRCSRARGNQRGDQPDE